MLSVGQCFLFGRTRPEEWTGQTAQVAACASRRVETRSETNWQESDVTTVEGAGLAIADWPRPSVSGHSQSSSLAPSTVVTFDSQLLCLTSSRDIRSASAATCAACFFYRAAWNAELQMRSSDVDSVRPSVCLLNACIVTKGDKDLSRFLYHTKDHLA